MTPNTLNEIQSKLDAIKAFAAKYGHDHIEPWNWMGSSLPEVVVFCHSDVLRLKAVNERIAWATQTLPNAWEVDTDSLHTGWISLFQIVDGVRITLHRVAKTQQMQYTAEQVLKMVGNQPTTAEVVEKLTV